MPPASFTFDLVEENVTSPHQCPYCDEKLAPEFLALLDRAGLQIF